MSTATEPKFTYLFLLLNADLTISLMEQLEGTPYYRQELKQLGNRFNKQLLAMTSEDLPLVWGVKDEIMYNLMDCIAELNDNIAKLKPDDAYVINTMIRRYREDPQAVLNALSISVTAVN